VEVDHAVETGEGCAVALIPVRVELFFREDVATVLRNCQWAEKHDSEIVTYFTRKGNHSCVCKGSEGGRRRTQVCRGSGERWGPASCVCEEWVADRAVPVL